MMHLLPLLREVAIFKDLRASELVKIAEVMERYAFVVGERLCEEGAPGGDSLQIIESGYVNVIAKDAKTGEEKNLTTLGPSACFGEISLLTGETHSATIVAISNGVMYKIKKEHFDRIMRANPSVALFMSKMLSKKFRDVLSFGKGIVEKNKVVAVISAKPEVGKSTLIANLATSLSRQTGRKTLAIDLNYAPGSLASVLNLQTPLNLADKMKGGRSFSFADIEEATVRHPMGLNVLGILAESIPEVLDAQTIARMLEQLRSVYDFVFVEVPSKVDNLFYDFLLRSDEILLISPANKKELVETFDFVKFIKRKVIDLEKKLKVVVQDGLHPAHIHKGQIEAILRVPVSEVLPHDATLADSLSISACPFVVSYPSAPISKVVSRLAREIGGIKVGLALSSGMAPGLAHVGVLKVFEKERIPVDIIAGTSGGAIFGAAIAGGMSPLQLERIALEVARRFLWFYTDFVMPPYSGFIYGHTIIRLVEKLLKGARFSDLEVPLKVLAADLQAGEPVVLDQGKISEAIRASISVPGIFVPVKVKGRFLVDGAAISPVPVSILHQKRANVVIAVNVNSSPADTTKQNGGKSNILGKVWQRFSTPNLFDIIMQSRAISAHRMAELDSARADVVVKPDTSNYKWRDYNKAKQIVEQGIIAAEKAVPRIKDLLSASSLK